ncbi:MAG TPA: GNAT family N-acetyltransferase [Pyrinomonadaceae bacterium]|nr:GNAT family N-acetyltransferase [Pyrinomonadaceae bacterium]
MGEVEDGRTVGAEERPGDVDGRAVGADAQTGAAVGRLSIEPATEEDVPLILRFVKELAEYERLAEAVTADEALLRAELFGEHAAEVLIARRGAEPVGFALYFYNFSTFVGRRGLYLEDLYVRPEERGRGTGRALLARLARVASERGCRRVEWAVLDWNEPAVGFYKKLGARPMDDWTVFRLEGDALERLAESAS